eukprot:CAMPEP_0171251846 /NCGR_PEP_ID=MMETSP0790-20130122/50852_1 /TAXON_ID=2925 /ORGANISM="Alexandrium catenella, Strain OF101" /LENGTH=104 /DNA_ID=CAMNT_0011719561 /DNA_START=19 /DNA_END=329 /DNA_ORIENTATION=+
MPLPPALREGCAALLGPVPGGRNGVGPAPRRPGSDAPHGGRGNMCAAPSAGITGSWGGLPGPAPSFRRSLEGPGGRGAPCAARSLAGRADRALLPTLALANAES